MTSPCESIGAHMTLESCSATTLSLLPKVVSASASDTMTGSAGLEHRAHDAVGDSPSLVGDALSADVAQCAHRDLLLAFVGHFGRA